jgi:hypothetical protein
MPAKCVSSVSPRFHYRRLAFCFLPLAAILEFSRRMKLDLYSVSILKKNQGVSIMAHTCNPSYSGGRSRKFLVLGWPKQKFETLSKKQTEAKVAGRVVQVVEYVPTKY